MSPFLKSLNSTGQSVFEPIFLFTCSAQLTGLEADKCDFLEEKMGTNYVDSLAEEIAVLPRGWDPNDMRTCLVLDKCDFLEEKMGTNYVDSLAKEIDVLPPYCLVPRTASWRTRK